MFKIFALRLINYRLKLMHLSGIGLAISSFFLLLFLDKLSGTHTLNAQLILLFISIFLVMGYLSVIAYPNKKPTFSLFIFYILNITTSILVWSTGILDSPFILLYPLIIISSSEIYGHGHGLYQMILSIIGFVLIYGGTANLILPYETILQNTKSDILYISPLVVFIYGLIYTLLIIYAATVSNLPKLYRMTERTNKDQDNYNEKILQELPIGVIVIDENLNMLSSNPIAMTKYAYAKTNANLANYLHFDNDQKNLKQKINQLASSGEEESVTWVTDDHTNLISNVKISYVKQENNNYYIIYLS